MIDFPRFVPTLHQEPYPAIDPTKADLRGKVVLITGGGSGIGRATCHALAKARVKDLIILDRDQMALADVKAELEASYHEGTTFHSFIVNLVDAPLIGDIFERIHSTIGDIDVLINNAAYQPTRAPYAKSRPEDWWLGFEINVKGSFNLIYAFLRHVKPGAVLINISSILAHWRTLEGYLDGQSSYSASKIAITRAMEILQHENDEIRVVNIHPGLVATGMAAKSGTTALSVDSVNLPAHFIVWAAGPQADFLKGRMVWAKWDVEELMAKSEEIVQQDLLTLGLRGFEY